MEREFSGALGGPTVSTPNSKETSPRRSLSGQCENKYNSQKTDNVMIHQSTNAISTLKLTLSNFYKK